MWKMLLPIMLLIVCLAGCRKQDMRTVIVAVPSLKNPAGAQIIQNAFMRQPGIKAIQPDFQQRTLTIQRWRYWILAFGLYLHAAGK